MKEKIYTIPVNEAYDSGEECPLCYLERKLETEALEYGLGAAMMEPDYRIKSNEMGYCNKHFEMLAAMPNKLSLSLVLESHLDTVMEKIKECEGSLTPEKKGLFSKKSAGGTESLSKQLKNIEESCIICDKINHTMDRYIEVIFYLWKRESEFREKFEKSKGLCLKHFKMLVERSSKYLGDADACEFSKKLTEQELKELERLKGDLKKFILKFDYRNRDMDISGAEDAPVRVAEKLGGYVRK